MKKVSIAILLTLCMALALVPTVAFATGTPAINLGTGVLSTGANTSDAQLLRYGGLSWYVIAYDGKDEAGNAVQYTPDGTDTPVDLYPEGTATLLSLDRPEETAYDTSSSAYASSTLRTKIDAIAAGIPTAEQAAVLPRTLAGGSGNYGSAAYNSNGSSGDSVENALLWPLSYAEAKAVGDDLRYDISKSEFWSDWWLRTPALSPIYATYVENDGSVMRMGNEVTSPWTGVRPAFYLDLDTVLFTSAGTDGKVSGAAGADALTAVGASAAAGWKLTLLDESRSGFAASYDSADGDVWTIKYSGAKSGTNEYISAVIVNSSDAITYYGRLAAAESGDDRTATVNVAGKLNEGDTLYVFNELCSGDDRTDYASALQEVAKPVVYGVTVTAGANMTQSGVGDLSQAVTEGEAMTALRFLADDGFFFPADYASLGTAGGVTVARESAAAITVSGSPSADVDLTLAAASPKVNEATPAAAFTATGYDTGTLTDLIPGARYVVTGAADADFVFATATDLTGVTPGTLSIVRKATDTDIYVDSTAQTVTVTRPAAPTGVSAAACATSADNDGSLAGVSAAMEYQRDGDADWTAVTGDGVTGLTPGVYRVRFRASGAALASEAATVTVAAWTKPEEISYKIIQGKDQVRRQDSSQDLVLVSSAAFSKFLRVEVDGKVLDAKYYAVASSSTKVTIFASYLKTLSPGAHTVSIVSTDGTATTGFTLTRATGGITVTGGVISPQTSDGGHMALYTVLLLLSSGGAGALTGLRRRRRR